MRLKPGYEKIECAILPAAKAKLKAWAALQGMTLQDAAAQLLSEIISDLKLKVSK
jgi:hypothetical protein